MVKKFFFLFFLLVINEAFGVNEKKFPDVPGEFDLNGVDLLYLASLSCQSPKLKREIQATISGVHRARYSGVSADCSIQRIDSWYDHEVKYCGWKYEYLRDRAQDVRALVEQMDKVQSSINWNDYLTDDFVDNDGNTLLHKLAELCNQKNNDEIVALIKAINNNLGPGGTIPSSFNNAIPNNDGQSVYAMHSCTVLGGKFSVFFKNKKGLTALDILEQKINDNTYLGTFLLSTCIPCESLAQQLREMSQRENNRQSIIDFINTGR